MKSIDSRYLPTGHQIGGLPGGPAFSEKVGDCDDVPRRNFGLPTCRKYLPSHGRDHGSIPIAPTMKSTG